MSPQEAIDAPSLCDGFYSAWGERVISGEFNSKLLDDVRAMGIQISELSKNEAAKVAGWWTGILIDPDRGKLIGGVPKGKLFIVGAMEEY
jgi:hypothetical protein